MRTISLLHPFSAKSVGLHELDFYYSHSKPHEKAMCSLQQEGYKVSIAYFTGRMLPFSKNIKGITKLFWPVTKPIRKKRHGWRKQHSLYHYWNSYFKTPDLTIINMSGHGSLYCFRLAKMLLARKKAYIAMIGGMHVSHTKHATAYYRNAHHIIVHTEIQKKQLLENELFKGVHIQVMPLGVDTSIFTPQEKKLESVELLFVGRISRLKQIELCIETLAILTKEQNKKVNLKIIGPASDAEYLEELKTLAIQLNIAEKVLFLDSLRQEELVSHYQSANLLLLPSAHESFGMVMVEAMACGTPVAALKGSGGPDEVVENGINGILTTKDKYAQKVLEYVQSEEFDFSLRKNARLLVEQKWSLAQTEAAFRNSINEVFL